VSVREQERRQKQVEKRINEAMRRADREVGAAAVERSRQADLRAKEVVRRIEKGDVDPRPLPGMREDSMESMESMPSMESSESMESMGSAQPVMEIEVGSDTQEDMQGMPLEDEVPFNAEEAGEDLAGRVTEESGGQGDPHAHNEQKSGDMAEQMTEDTGAGGDMTEHAEGKIAQHGERMFEE
jgi:hypothetical protein